MGVSIYHGGWSIVEAGLELYPPASASLVLRLQEYMVVPGDEWAMD